MLPLLDAESFGWVDNDDQESPMDEKVGDRQSKAVSKKRQRGGIEKSTLAVDFTEDFAWYLKQLLLEPHKPSDSIPDVDSVIATLRLLLEDREVTPVPTAAQFTSAFRKKKLPSILCGAGERCCEISLIQSGLFGVEEARRIVSGSQGRVHMLVIVSQRVPTNHARAELDRHAETTGAAISFFSMDELLKPYVRHYLVPKHSAVPSEQEEGLLRKLRCKKENMMVIEVGDAVCRWYGWKCGTVVRVDRKFGGNNQQCAEWRVVSFIP